MRLDRKADELRAAIFADGTQERASEEAKKAIAYCKWCICEYENWFEWNETRWIRWQQVTIIGGVVATLAGVITLPAGWIGWVPDIQSFSWLRGVPAAIATIAAGYLASFNFKEDTVRHELTANALWNELAKYQTRAQPYDDNESADTSLFVGNICRIVESELHSWSTLVRGNRTEEENKGQQPHDTVTPVAPDGRGTDAADR